MIESLPVRDAGDVDDVSDLVFWLSSSNVGLLWKNHHNHGLLNIFERKLEFMKTLKPFYEKPYANVPIF
jgi:hypothetical protein